ncbi:AgmX/PglI C-terminal domain-containing protein, partial [Myxococcota bacterium]|nr:AgmX/PglI C-terminal domain-containing protein [Myxococcota bacterium]
AQAQAQAQAVAQAQAIALAQAQAYAAAQAQLQQSSFIPGQMAATSALPGMPVMAPVYEVPSMVPQAAPSMVPQGAMPSNLVTSQVMTMPPVRYSPWGSVPNNLASDGVPESERALEIKLVWGNTVVDSVNATNEPVVTTGDERKTTGWGPFQKLVRCDLEVPSKGLPSATFPLAQSISPAGCTYAINIPSTFSGRIERADGTMSTIEDLLKTGRGVERGDAGAARYTLNAAETLFLQYGELTYQIRYIRRAKLIPPGFFAELNYSWVNMLILAFFIHGLAIVSFVATPVTQAQLDESLFKNPNRFAQFRLTPEEKKKKEQNDFLSKLKEGAAGAKAKGAEGKAGRKDYTGKKQGRMAVKGDPNDKEIAKSTLAKLFGAKGNTGRSYLFGSGGLGGELKGALGGVTGAEIGDAAGLGGLGTRGSGPGGGGLSMNSVGLGALGTAGRGGGNGGYGDGVGGLGKKADRDINISAGALTIMGSLDKEIIRRVIKEHLAQIRYCYEKELTRTPGLFGKVSTEFVISAQGTVQSAEVKKGDSTLNNDEVERCITSKIRTWVFPKPKGGGVVVVKYPFIFKTTG